MMFERFLVKRVRQKPTFEGNGVAAGKQTDSLMRRSERGANGKGINVPRSNCFGLFQLIANDYKPIVEYRLATLGFEARILLPPCGSCQQFWKHS